MIIKINIYSPENFINLKINSEKNWAEYNGIEISKDFSNEITKLIDIFSNWEKENANVYVFDAEKINVEVIEDNISKKISLSGDYPQNYDEFK
ncbi:MAG: hypothetical protein J6Q58_00690, partial [Clostridia bacterium]|nr:hypothetical protein [Clostridia bacterium]